MMSRKLRDSDRKTSSEGVSSFLSETPRRIRQRAPFITNAHVLEVILAMIPQHPGLNLSFTLADGLLPAH
jgi:hypothetical protein